MNSFMLMLDVLGQRTEFLASGGVGDRVAVGNLSRVRSLSQRLGCNSLLRLAVRIVGIAATSSAARYASGNAVGVFACA